MPDVTVSILPLKDPLVDNTGILTNVWARYFWDLWQRTGGAVDQVGGIDIGKPTTASALVVFFANALGQVAQDPGFFHYDNANHQFLIGGANSGAAKIILDASTGTATFKFNLFHAGAQLGFFNTSPVSKTPVADPPAIVTTETAGGSYTSNEQDMLNNLKTDVTNLQSSLKDLADALQSYGLV